MKAVIQRVSTASVTVDGSVVGRIDRGILLFLAVERGDTVTQVQRMVHKVGGLRIFPDEAGRMNRSLADISGAILAISQFTLAADLKKGFRPSFGNAEDPQRAQELFDQACRRLEAAGIPVARGRFGADMAVTLVNDGPVTFWLDFPPG